ncbi:MAG: cysteine--tRNA ligase [Helicobacteraceae bacterium]|jgi:cysteinyl-tRNA synthetase|nr:cysteine--tRNA ligase [Helicobacteraceae bacterium]
MYIYDSHEKAKVRFEPEFEGAVRIYLCGPTVYDDAHLGHARSAICFDLLRRTLGKLGYKVLFARNITDIDDKILNKIAQTNKSLEEIATLYSESYHNDMSALNVLPADVEPKATDHIPQMIDLISRLLENGAAYRALSGDIYFDASGDQSYGLLSGETQEETQSRISVEAKRSPRDFVLWKLAKADEVSFDSPFGRGRPGWHVECSAMAQTHLWREEAQYACDIHAGGMDLFFPHHENEAAQTRCAFDNKLSRYWMHNGFVRIDGQKMSKSVGNSFFVKDALGRFQGESLRFYLMSIHYRAGLNYNDSDLFASKKRLDRIYRLKQRLLGGAGEPQASFLDDLLAAMSDDMNISKALAVVDEMISSANEKLSSTPKDDTLRSLLAGNLKLIEELLGVGTRDPFEWFQFGIDPAKKVEIERLIEERAAAKKSRDFNRADRIRDELSSIQIALLDTTDGTVWEKL